MQSVDADALSHVDTRLLQELPHDGMRIEDIVNLLSVSYPTAKHSVHKLTDMGLLIPGHDFAYEPDTVEVKAVLSHP